MSTNGTSDLEDTLRDRLLTFASLGGDTLADVLGRTEADTVGDDGKLFWDAAPDNASSGVSRWGLLRLQNRRGEGDGQERELADLEVMLFARPRIQKATLEHCADLCDQAMLRYTDASTLGYIGTLNGRKRDPLPPFTGPADAEVVQIRLVYPLYVYREDLTQYHDQA